MGIKLFLLGLSIISCSGCVTIQPRYYSSQLIEPKPTDEPTTFEDQHIKVRFQNYSKYVALRIINKSDRDIAIILRDAKIGISGYPQFIISADYKEDIKNKGTLNDLSLIHISEPTRPY